MRQFELLEYKIEKIPLSAYRDITVWVNPTRNIIKTLIVKFDTHGGGDERAEGILRGWIDDKDNLYIWDSYKATHADLRASNKLTANRLIFEVYVFKREWGPSIAVFKDFGQLDAQEMRQIPCLNRLMDLNKTQSIKEMKIETVEGKNGELGVYENPSSKELLTLFKRNPEGLRAILDSKDDIFIWNADKSVHSEIERELGIDSKYFLHLFEPYEDEKEWNADFFPIVISSFSPYGGDWNHQLAQYRLGNMPVLRRLYGLPAHSIHEAVESWDSGLGDRIKILKNPSSRTFQRLLNQFKQLRAMIDEAGDIFIWNAFAATHYQVRKELGIKATNCMTLDNYTMKYYCDRFPQVRKLYDTKLTEEDNSARDKDFDKLANDQRGRPEMVMLAAQSQNQAERGNLPSYNTFTWALEHGGDLTNRMSQRFSSLRGQPDNIQQKLRVVLRVINNPIDAERIKELPDFPEFQKYSEEHAKLQVYNEAQRAARDLAVALGKRDFNEVRRNAEILQNMLDNGTYKQEAGKYIKESLMDSKATNKIYYHATFNSRVRSIMKDGLVIGKRRNWNNAIGNKLGTDNIYLIDDLQMAVRWAANMEWEFKKKISILVVKNPPGEIKPDPHWQSAINNKSWFITDENIPPSCIVESIPLTLEMKRNLVSSMKNASIHSPLESLNEYKIEKVNGNYHNVKVYINPKKKEFSKLFDKLTRNRNTRFNPTIKGIIDQADNLYLWDGMQLVHRQMAIKLGIIGSYYLYLSDKLENSICFDAFDNRQISINKIPKLKLLYQREPLKELQGIKQFNVKKMNQLELIHKMDEFGFKAVGSGFFSDVFEYDKNPNLVIKVFVDRAYEKYIEFCKVHSNNPCLPKFKGRKIKITTYKSAIRIEKLLPLTMNDWVTKVRPVTSLFPYLNLGGAHGEINGTTVKDIDPNFSKEQIVLYNTLVKINEFRKSLDIRVRFDFRIENFMKRGDGQIVITDPLA